MLPTLLNAVDDQTPTTIREGHYGCQELGIEVVSFRAGGIDAGALVLQVVSFGEP